MALLFNLISGAAGALIWYYFDQREHEKLPRILWTCCRYYLSFVVMGYGMAKVFPIQFHLKLVDLITPLGQSSPMGLLWKMMGYSYAYSFFSGLAEVVGSFLLLFRRTTTLGALILIAVMSNVVMLNLCYDIPVKLLSIHLLLFSIALLIPDRERLAKLFMDPDQREASRPRLALKILFALVSAGTILFLFEERTEPPLYGIFEVVDGGNMRYLVFDKGYAVIQQMDDSRRWFEVNFDSGQVFLHTNAFTYQQEGNQLLLAGEFEGEQLHLTLKKKELNDFLLMNRGFHWINEYPVNR